MFNQIIQIDFAGHSIGVQYRQIVIVAVTAVLLVSFWWLVQRTNLGRATAGRRVNLEVDVLAKYVEKLIGATR